MLKRMLVVGLILICCASSAYLQKRGPSTPEERKRAADMATFLEEKPLAKEEKGYRAALLYFLAEGPHITGKIRTDVLGELRRVKGDYEPAVVGQLPDARA